MTVASPDPRNIIGHVPMRLCVGPSDLTLAFPHGGTALGEIEDASIMVDSPTQILTAEEYGNEPYDAICGGEAWSLAFLLREWNVAAYSRFFINAAAGGTSGHALVQAPGSTRAAGLKYSSRAAVFCFAPIDADNHPFVIFYAGMPMLQETARLAARLGGVGDRFSVPGVIIAIRDGSDRTHKTGRRSDIVL